MIPKYDVESTPIHLLPYRRLSLQVHVPAAPRVIEACKPVQWRICVAYASNLSCRRSNYSLMA